MFLSDKSFSFMDACGGSINNSHRNSVYTFAQHVCEVQSI